jgi:hypothetical protein
LHFVTVPVWPVTEFAKNARSRALAFLANSVAGTDDFSDCVNEKWKLLKTVTF